MTGHMSWHVSVKSLEYFFFVVEVDAIHVRICRHRHLQLIKCYFECKSVILLCACTHIA